MTKCEKGGSPNLLRAHTKKLPGMVRIKFTHGVRKVYPVASFEKLTRKKHARYSIAPFYVKFEILVQLLCVKLSVLIQKCEYGVNQVVVQVKISLCHVCLSLY